jgi:hypothetical protein
MLELMRIGQRVSNAYLRISDAGRGRDRKMLDGGAARIQASVPSTRSFGEPLVLRAQRTEEPEAYKYL